MLVQRRKRGPTHLNKGQKLTISLSFKEKEDEKRKTAMAKQAHTMSSFFKAKAVASPAPIARKPGVADPSSKSTVSIYVLCLIVSPAPTFRKSSPVTSDFHKAFKPVVHRQNVAWAEINHWVKSKRRSRTAEKAETDESPTGAQAALVSRSEESYNIWERRGEQ